MGLDISVYKVIDLGDTNPNDIENYYILKDYPVLSIFNDKSFNKYNDYYDLDTPAKKLGYNLDDLECEGSSFGEDVKYDFKDKDGNKIQLIDPPLITKKDRCIAVEEIGYQRKGANKQFYDDGMWDDPALICVVSLDLLKEHAKKYFEENFVTNIVNKFEEGKTFVMYH
jgi:hypothetical protein